METPTNRVDQEWINNLYKEFTQALTKIQEDATLKRLSQAIQVSKNFIRTLRTYILSREFETPADEIRFFKQHKPKFYSHLFYYSESYQCEINRPTGSVQAQKEYYSAEMNRLQHDFEKNREFYAYLRAGESHLDECYFLRGKQHNIIYNGLVREIDPEFATGFDLLVAVYWTHEKLAAHLNKKMTDIDKPPVSFELPVETPRLLWTDSKSALIELIYAFKARGSFNNGQATLKDITDVVQQVFGIELTNPTRDFQEILRRKTGYTIYLDGLKESYLQYIDKIETRDRR